MMVELARLESGKERVENSEEGKRYHKTHPQKWFWFPPPPVCPCPAILLKGNGRRPDKSHFLSPPELVLELALYNTFPPLKIARDVFPPHLLFPNKIASSSFQEEQHKHTVFGPNFLRTFLTLTPGCPGSQIQVVKTVF